MTHLPSTPGNVLAWLPGQLPAGALTPGVVALICLPDRRLSHDALVLAGHPDPDDDPVDVAEVLLGAACDQRARGVAVVAYLTAEEDATSPFTRSAQIAAAVVLRAAGHGLVALDALRVRDGRWASYLCTNPSCCPPDGSPIPTTPEEPHP